MLSIKRRSFDVGPPLPLPGSRLPLGPTMIKNWHEVSIRIPVRFQEAVIDFVMGLGIQGVVVDDQKPNRPLLTVYFPEENGKTTHLDRLRTYFKNIGLSRRAQLTVRRRKEEDWHRLWQRFSVSLLPIGERLLIRAPWHTVPHRYHPRLLLTLEPGMAFGTGSHPTTRHCLELLETVMGEGPIRRVLDLGCGSGILAMAAVRLGAQTVLAVDHDPIALQTARRNAERNRIRRVRFALKPPARARFDLVTANLLYDSLIGLPDYFHRVLEEGGRLIVSGLLVEQLAPLASAYRPFFERERVRKTRPWGSLLFRKKPADSIGNTRQSNRSPHAKG